MFILPNGYQLERQNSLKRKKNEVHCLTEPTFSKPDMMVCLANETLSFLLEYF